MACGHEAIACVLVRHRKKGRKTHAKAFTYAGISRVAVLIAVTGGFTVVRAMHHLGDMRGVIRHRTHACRMR